MEGMRSDDEDVVVKGARCIMKKQGSVRGLLHHKEVNFQDTANQTR